MKAFPRISLVICCVLATGVACENTQITNQLDDIDGYIIQKPDSALAELRSIDTLALNSKSLRAHYSLLMAMALDKNYIDTTNIAVIQPALDYYEHHGNVDQKLRTYYYLGRIQHNAKNSTEAIRAFTVAYDLSDKSYDLTYKKMICSALGLEYSGSYDSEEALKYTLKTFDYACQQNDSIGRWKVTARLAMYYHNYRDDAKSDSLFKVYMRAPIYDTAIYAKNLLQYAKVLAIKKPTPEPERSIEIFMLSKNTYRGRPTKEDYFVHAYALEKAGRREESEKLLGKLSKYTINSHTNQALADWCYKINKHKGNYKEALRYFEYALKGQDSIIISKCRQSLERARSSYYEEKAKGVSLNLIKERQEKVITLFAAIIIIIGIIWAFYLRRKRWISRIEQIESLKSDMTILQQKYLINNKKQFRVLHNLCASYLEPSAKRKQDKIYDEIKKSLTELIVNDTIPSKAELIVNEEFNNIMSKLRQDCPSHSEESYRLYSFLFMDFSLKTISIILGVSPESVRTRKYRLKQEILSKNSPFKETYLALLDKEVTLTEQPVG